MALIRSGWNIALRHPFIAAVATVLLIQSVVVIRQEQIRRDYAHDLAVTALERCQDRNAQQAGTRGKFQVQTEILATLGIDPTAIVALSVVIGIPDDEDTDCDSDGVVTINDYPTGRSPAEILAALRGAAGIVTANPDAPVVGEAVPLPDPVGTTSTTRSPPRRTTTTRPPTTTTIPSTTTSPPPLRPPGPPDPVPTCELLGVFLPLCPVPGL